jgi:chemotaxis protein MotB
VSRKRRHKAHVNHERWLVSYADFITLLFAFFVVLYASSQADKKKAAQVAASIKGAFQQLGVFTGSATEGIGVPGSPGILHPELTDAPLKVVKVAGSSEKNTGWGGLGVDVDELRRQLEGALGDESRQHEVQMRVTPEGLVVSLREVGFFNSGQAELLQNGHNTLTRIATILGGRGFEIRVEGHTDNVPVHNSRFKSNWELSTARATAVVALLIEQHGFDPLLVSAAGYSEYRPVESNSSERGRAANRRVDLVVVGHVPEKDKLAQTEAPPAGQESYKFLPPSASLHPKHSLDTMRYHHP